MCARARPTKIPDTAERVSYRKGRSHRHTVVSQSAQAPARAAEFLRCVTATPGVRYLDAAREPLSRASPDRPRRPVRPRLISTYCWLAGTSALTHSLRIHKQCTMRYLPQTLVWRAGTCTHISCAAARMQTVVPVIADVARALHLVMCYGSSLRYGSEEFPHAHRRGTSF